jgi:microcystin-dependent protein
MTGQIKSAAGLVTTPGISFNGALSTGFYLAGSNQIGIATNSIQLGTFNSDQSTTWAGAATFGGTISATKGTIPVGGVMDFAGSTAPAGWLLCYGQQVSTTTYAALFAVLSTTYGSGSGTFGIPDYRGRATFGQDNMGGSAAGRITVAGLSFDGTILGNSGGSQNTQISVSQMPSHNHGVTDPGHTHLIGLGANTGTQLSPAASGPTASGNAGTATTPTGITIQNTGSGTPFTILSPAIITTKIIYCGI